MKLLILSEISKDTCKSIQFSEKFQGRKISKITIPIYFLNFNFSLENCQALVLYEGTLISQGSGELGISSWSQAIPWKCPWKSVLWLFLDIPKSCHQTYTTAKPQIFCKDQQFLPLNFVDCYN